LLAEQLRDLLDERAAALTPAASAAASPATTAAPLRPLVLLGSDTLFPFRPRPSVIIVPGIPTGIIACMPLLEEWGIASRLASTADLPGCFEGTVTALADAWLSSLNPTDLAEVEIFAHGPAPMLEASVSVARKFGLPCQV
jgi:dihydroorotate dehydrogenase electron transfer subunit